MSSSTETPTKGSTNTDQVTKNDCKRRKVFHTTPPDLVVPTWAPVYKHVEPVPCRVMVLAADIPDMDTILPEIEAEKSPVRQILTQVKRRVKSLKTPRASKLTKIKATPHSDNKRFQIYLPTPAPHPLAKFYSKLDKGRKHGRSETQPDNPRATKRRRIASIRSNYDVREKILSDENNVDAFRFVKHVQKMGPKPPSDTSAPLYGLCHRQGQPQIKHPFTQALPPLPDGSQKPTLVLDLDETLVHSIVEGSDDFDYKFGVNFSGHDYTVYVRKRPHVEEFLRQVAKWYDIVVFTASQAVYANKVLDLLAKDVGKDVVCHRLFREDCTVVDGNYMKDLTILKRGLETTILVDNSPSCFGFQVENGIPIVSWFDQPDDRELLDLLDLLRELRHVQDVRPVLQQKFEFQKYVDQCEDW